MKINIIRGQDQIGGSIIEISTESTRIILDAGINLGESKVHSYVPPIDGLFVGRPGYDAVFASHYHSDHTGLLRFVIPVIPIYMGETAYKITKSVADYKGREAGFSVKSFLEEFVPVTVGDLTVTPIPCDHSAYGAFMFLVSVDGPADASVGAGANINNRKTLLYTADYRSTGRKDFNILLESLPDVDVLITEGTTLSRGEDFHEPREQELEDFAVETMAARSGPAFVYLSAQNVDRIITAYNAARRTDRRFIMDTLTDTVARAAGLCLEGAVVSNVFEMHPGVPGIRPGAAEKSDLFAKNDFLLCVTPQTLPNIERLNRRISFENGTLFFGRREKYMLKPVTAALIALLKSKGVIVPILHTSGHADSNTIHRLITAVDPSVIIPVHTENAAWFSRYEDKCEVIYECRGFEV